MQVCIPAWQHKFHIATEVLAVLAVPLMYAAAASAPEPHKTRLYIFGTACLLVDGYLLLRWLKLKK